VVRRIAAAPSVMWEEFPAVVLPFSGSNTGLSLDRIAGVVCARIPSSVVTPPTGRITSVNFQECCAIDARWWEIVANSSN